MHFGKAESTTEVDLPVPLTTKPHCACLSGKTKPMEHSTPFTSPIGYRGRGKHRDKTVGAGGRALKLAHLGHLASPPTCYEFTLDRLKICVYPPLSKYMYWSPSGGTGGQWGVSAEGLPF